MQAVDRLYDAFEAVNTITVLLLHLLLSLTCLTVRLRHFPLKLVVVKLIVKCLPPIDLAQKLDGNVIFQ